jgi:hypothetical protein
MSEFSELEALIKSCERSLNANDLDRAEAGINYVNEVIRKAKSDAQDDDYEDVSNPSMDAADDDGDDGDDDDDDEDNMDKAFHERSTSGAPARMRGQHVAVNRPDTYRLSAEPQPQGRTKRHRFESRIERIRSRDGVSKTEAMSRARVEHPVLFAEYQDHLARRSTSQQHVTRGWDQVGKRGSETFESLVSEQIAKGCSPSLAAQRVANLHGYEAMRNSMYKGESRLADRFQKRVDRLIEEGYSGTDACQIVRQSDPLLFKAMQIV